jgi:iron(III) transport system substrate-binding protein
MVKHMGEKEGLAYFRKLAESKTQVWIGHTSMVQLLAAGEMHILAAAYNHNVERDAQLGAPIKWKAFSPTFG